MYDEMVLFGCIQVFVCQASRPMYDKHHATQLFICIFYYLLELIFFFYEFHGQVQANVNNYYEEMENNNIFPVFKPISLLVSKVIIMRWSIHWLFFIVTRANASDAPIVQSTNK